MSNVINNPPNDEDSSGAVGIIVGIIILAVLVVLFFVYALPAVRGTGTPAEAPQSDSLDVNVMMPTSDRVPANDPAPTPAPTTEANN